MRQVPKDLKALHAELQTLQWIGADKGWDAAIDAVSARIALMLATPAPTPVAGEGVGDAVDAVDVVELVHSLISGKTVSVDVSTGDDDAGNRIFATVYEVQEDVDGFVILCDDPHWNYPNVSALQADHSEDVRTMVLPDGYKLVPIEPTPAMIQAGIDTDLSETTEEADDYRNVYAAMLAASPALGDSK